MKYFYLLLVFMSPYIFSCFGQNMPSSQALSISIAPLLTQRHSGRSYDAFRLISLEQMRLLAEAARLAPSCYNDQPWTFIFCNRSTHLQAYEKVFNCLVEFNQNWAKNAPLLVVIVANQKFGQTKEPNRWGTYDTGAAAISMALQASSMGLMAHQMGGFDEAKIQKEFQIPEGYIPMAVMAVGYESKEEADHIPPKDRKSLEENFFLGEWQSKF